MYKLCRCLGDVQSPLQSNGSDLYKPKFSINTARVLLYIQSQTPSAVYTTSRYIYPKRRGIPMHACCVVPFLNVG